MAALCRALRLAFRDLERPRTDPLWEPLRTRGDVRDMLGIIDADTMSRDEGWRADLAFLAREVQRRTPSRDLDEAEFGAAAARLAAAVPEMSDTQIIVGMLKLLRPLGDGHAYIAPAEDDQDLNRILPVKFYLFPEGLFVTAVTPPHRRLLGAQLLAVGQHDARCDVEQALAALEPLISRDNAQQVRWLGPEVLRWPAVLHALGLIADPGCVPLTVRFPDGTSGTVTVGSQPAGPRAYPAIAPPPTPTRPRPPGWISLPDTLPFPLPLYLRNSDILYWYEYLAEHRLVYFQFNGVGDHPAQPLAAFYERLFRFIDRHEVATLVIDLRWNGGGNTYLTQPLLHHLIACEQGLPLRDHRAGDLLRGPEHRNRHRTRDQRHLRRRAVRIAPQLHRGGHPVPAAVQQDHSQRRGPVLADLVAHGSPAVDRPRHLRAAHLRGLPQQPRPGHGSDPRRPGTVARQLTGPALRSRCYGTA